MTEKPDLNMACLVKGLERYVFLYDDKNRANTLRVLGEFAANQELSFTLSDAATLSKHVRGSQLKKWKRD
jgi:hypothetical protein